MAPGRHRILVNAVHARAGGGVTYLRNLLPLLAAEADLDVHLIPHPSQADAFAALSPELTVHHIAMPAGWLPLLLWEQAILPLLAWRIGYDVILSPANFGPLLLPAQVIVVQNAIAVGAQERRFGKKLYWASLRAMTALSLLVVRRAIAVSQYVAETTPARLRHAAPVVVHHGVAAMFSPPPTGDAREDFLLVVGDLYVQKNLHTLIEALALVHREYPAIVLRIAGTEIDADYAAALHRLVRKRGLGDAIVFLGRRDNAEIVELYRRCVTFVFPSTIESFGMPLVEAMACGAPVVASNTTAMPEIAGGAALLCDPAEPRDIAAAILRVLGDPALRQSLSERALLRAKAFSWVDCARRTATVLREAAAGRPRRAAATPSPSR
jgi:glycosyltransferase involved in cell wall biosynthesis